MGRPGKGPTERVDFNLSADLHSAMLLLLDVLDPKPTKTAFLESAVAKYVELKLRDPDVKAAFDARLAPDMKVISIEERTALGRGDHGT